MNLFQQCICSAAHFEQHRRDRNAYLSAGESVAIWGCVCALCECVHACHAQLIAPMLVLEPFRLMPFFVPALVLFLLINAIVLNTAGGGGWVAFVWMSGRFLRLELK